MGLCVEASEGAGRCRPYDLHRRHVVTHAIKGLTTAEGRDEHCNWIPHEGGSEAGGTCTLLS